MWTRLGKAVLTAVLVVMVAELAAQAAFSRIEFAHSYDEPRNPNFRRAWPAFTEPRTRGPNDKLIILISNSQGYAPELHDGEQCYAHQLQMLLNEPDSGHRYTVANWSIGGGSGPEMLLLAARAIEHKPDLLMLVTHSEPFTHTRVKLELSMHISDSNQLACDPEVRASLPDWFRTKLGRPDIGLYLESNSCLMRLRSTFVEHRERRWVPRQQNVERDKGPHLAPLGRASRVRRSGVAMIDSIARTFREGLPDTPVLVVSMPLCGSKWDPRSWPGLHGFGDLASQVLNDGFPDDPKITVIDAVDAVDQDLFITRTHMVPEGHAAFSQYLLPHVRTCLDEPPTSEPALP